MLTSANDTYLKSLIESAKAAIQLKGITLTENDINVDTAVVQYAAYLFRKRAAADTAMPRFLRLLLNNLHISQHSGGGS